MPKNESNLVKPKEATHKPKKVKKVTKQKKVTKNSNKNIIKININSNNKNAKSKNAKSKNENTKKEKIEQSQQQPNVISISNPYPYYPNTNYETQMFLNQIKNQQIMNTLQSNNKLLNEIKNNPYKDVSPFIDFNSRLLDLEKLAYNDNTSALTDNNDYQSSMNETMSGLSSAYSSLLSNNDLSNIFSDRSYNITNKIPENNLDDSSSYDSGSYQDVILKELGDNHSLNPLLKNDDSYTNKNLFGEDQSISSIKEDNVLLNPDNLETDKKDNSSSVNPDEIIIVKKRRGRPKIDKPPKEPKKRGRPKGSRNKPIEDYYLPDFEISMLEKRFLNMMDNPKNKF